MHIWKKFPELKDSLSLIQSHELEGTHDPTDVAIKNKNEKQKFHV